MTSRIGQVDDLIARINVLTGPCRECGTPVGERAVALSRTLGHVTRLRALGRELRVRLAANRQT